MSFSEGEGCFTLTWTIENYSLLLGPSENGLRSPSWKIDTSRGSTWWRLRAYHTVSKVLFNLNSLIGRSPILNRCELFIITSSDGEIPLKDDSNSKFSIEKSFLLGHINKLAFPSDTLTLHCKMWNKTMTPGKCHIHSILLKLDYIWNSKNEKSDDPDYIFVEKNNFLMYVNVQKKNNNGTHTVIVGSALKDDNCMSFVDCNWLINDGLGHVINKEFIYPYVCARCEIENFKVKSEYSGLEFRLECIYAVHNNHTLQLSSANNLLLHSPGALNNDLLKICKDGIFSDAILITDGKSFSAHKSILAARSQVFCCMFQKDQMSEGSSGVVLIEDIVASTLGRMLTFLYSDTLEEMSWEDASALYYAADKYAIPCLKQKCADILKAGLALDNACAALILADTHSDQELMKCTTDFIRNHQEVISSAEWEKLEKSHTMLAAKSLREVIVRK